MKVVFLVNGPLTDRWLRCFCLDELSSVFDVEYWDCTYLIKHANIVSSPLNREYVHSDITWQTLNDELKRLPNDTIIVPEVAMSIDNFPLFYRVSQYVHTAICLDFWHSSVSIGEKDTYKQYRSKSGESIWFKIKKNVRSILFNLWWKHKFYTYYCSVDPHAHHSLNAPDVEKYLSMKDTPHQERGRYVVYVGQYFPLHTDIPRLEKRDVRYLAQPFYDTLNAFFDKVERDFDCKVIIAEHPSGKHEINPFGGREIVYYQTAELIRDSVAVCMHYSNSSSFVVLYDKPLAILNCEQIVQVNTFYSRLAAFADALEMPLINMETISDAKNVFTPIRPDIRKRIISTLLPSGRTKNNVQLLEEYIREIHQIANK